MSKALDDVVERIKKLSEQRQQYAAEVLEQIVQAGDVDFVLSDQERRLVREGLEELDRGEFASEAEVEAVFAKYRR